MVRRMVSFLHPRGSDSWIPWASLFPGSPLPCPQTPAIADHFRLDGVVTLVDAKNVLRQLGSYQPDPDQPPPWTREGGGSDR